MNGIDRREIDRARAVSPMTRRRRLVIEGVLRIPVDMPNEGQRRGPRAARRMAEIDSRRLGVACDHAAEQVRRYAAASGYRCSITACALSAYGL